MAVIRKTSLTIGAIVAVAASASTPAWSVEKPPLLADAPPAATTTSNISATVEFSLSALDRALEAKVPRRLASFGDRGTSCWHRRIFFRMVNIDCEYSGFVDRTGPISLHADNGRPEAAMPLFGTVSGQGIGRFAQMLHGTGEGALMVYTSARPRLNKDWSVSLDMSEGFRWQEPPTLQLLGFRIDLTRYVEPKVRAQIERVRGDAAASVAAMDIRGKAASAWQQAFASLKIVDAPAIWLTTTPQSVAFSGIRARGGVLEGVLAISGTTETSIGEQPAAPAPTPLPALGSDITDPGHFSIIIPINIDYNQIRQKIQDALATRAPNGLPTVNDVTVYPSSGKVVAGLHIASKTGNGTWIYLNATPQVDANAQTMQFGDLSIVPDPSATEGSPLAEMLSDPALIQDLKNRMQFAFHDEWKNIVNSANARLTRPLAGGFRSVGNLASVNLSKVSLLPDGMRIDLRASGELKILYGL